MEIKRRRAAAPAGYTCLDQKTGHEFSAVAGLTYSAMNPFLQYQNGIDFHLDWGASQFISKNVHVGLVGYYFQQLTDDRGPGAKLGGFRGQAVGLGPQIGFIIPLSKDYQGYLNIKGYKDLETVRQDPEHLGDLRDLVGATRGVRQVCRAQVT